MTATLKKQANSRRLLFIYLFIFFYYQKRKRVLSIFPRIPSSPLASSLSLPFPLRPATSDPGRRETRKDWAQARECTDSSFTPRN
jgi:hypothetical protein